ncbi:putative transporter protein SLAC1/Mae1/ Ssu1/TehA [Helianthus annuus]|nr:putative transporter protein SLAC1/Mae1/ Ssu1/TehA [Helianthus annuus]
MNFNNLVLWCSSVVLFAIVAAAYLLKIIIYFEAVRRKYYHPIRVNFFFAPWIALLFFGDWSPIKGDHRTTAFPMVPRWGSIFFFAVGMAHYTVLFVTLYQRLPTNETLPKELHPVFFLFVAAPSVASMAWARINDSFDYGSRIAYFIAMFLYFSLAVPVNFFRGFKFSLAWWAYTFPMTGATIATIRCVLLLFS